MSEPSENAAEFTLDKTGKKIAIGVTIPDGDQEAEFELKIKGMNGLEIYTVLHTFIAGTKPSDIDYMIKFFRHAGEDLESLKERLNAHGFGAEILSVTKRPEPQEQTE